MASMVVLMTLTWEIVFNGLCFSQLLYSHDLVCALPFSSHIGPYIYLKSCLVLLDSLMTLMLKCIWLDSLNVLNYFQNTVYYMVHQAL